MRARIAALMPVSLTIVLPFVPVSITTLRSPPGDGRPMLLLVTSIKPSLVLADARNVTEPSPPKRT